MPEEAEWAVIELLDILKPFQRATEAMGGVYTQHSETFAVQAIRKDLEDS